MSITTVEELKKRTNDARVWGDAIKVFEETDHELLVKYAEALTNVKQFTDLTMRDDFLLNCANHQICNNINAMQGNISDPPQAKPSMKERISSVIDQYNAEESFTADELTREIAFILEEY